MPKLSTDIKLIFARQFQSLDAIPQRYAMLMALLNDGMGTQGGISCIVEDAEATLTFTSPHNLYPQNVVTISGAQGELAALNAEWRVKRVSSPIQLVIDAYGIPDGNGDNLACAFTIAPGWNLINSNGATQLWQNDASGLYVLLEEYSISMGFAAGGDLISLADPKILASRYSLGYADYLGCPTIAANAKAIVISAEGKATDYCTNDLLATAPDAICMLNGIDAATSVLTQSSSSLSIVKKNGTPTLYYDWATTARVYLALNANTVLAPVIMGGGSNSSPAWIAPHLLQVYGANPLDYFEVIELNGIRYMNPWSQTPNCPQLLNISDWSDIPDAL
ncbi:MAG: hypothetical protein LBQ81_07315 [Zoogloeaceae bacterium]|jgi:hypothetical protein|nr:hypothetical protein [Zoogloeaceae bacterium]